MKDLSQKGRMGRWPARTVAITAAAVSLVVLSACGALSASSSNRPSTALAQLASSSRVERVSGGPNGTYLVPPGIHKIKHVIVIQQENRTFDTYFGTYPGADGIPMKNGKPAVCVEDPRTKQCVAPYIDHADVNGGGPHNYANET
ncbi:MAG TPA: alkaline phosphatase family protein, partial [Acidimicrobiales bacterium]